jgi:hypothetical protein
MGEGFVMRTILGIAAAALVLSVSASASLSAQGPPEAAVRDFFNGQQMLVTYREGGPLYGTFFTLQVHFCRSGRYLTFGESRRHTVLDNEQVNRFTDEGTWEVTTVRGQMVLRYVSVSGQPNMVAINVAPGGRVSLGDGSITVIRQGVAQCPR